MASIRKSSMSAAAVPGSFPAVAVHAASEGAPRRRITYATWMLVKRAIEPSSPKCAYR